MSSCKSKGICRDYDYQAGSEVVSRNQVFIRLEGRTSMSGSGMVAQYGVHRRVSESPRLKRVAMNYPAAELRGI